LRRFIADNRKNSQTIPRLHCRNNFEITINIMAASIRQFALLLVFLTAVVLARQPGTLPRRRIAVRGTTSSHISNAHHRRLGVGHGGDGGKGKGGDKASGKSEKSPKSSSGGGKHKGDHEQDDDDEEEVKEPHVDSEDLPSADDDSSEDEDEDGKSPKGGPGTKGDKGEGKDEEKDDGKGKGKGKGSEHFQHGTLPITDLPFRRVRCNLL
jgi:hypothetical protein